MGGSLLMSLDNAAPASTVALLLERQALSMHEFKLWVCATDLAKSPFKLVSPCQM